MPPSQKLGKHGDTLSLKHRPNARANVHTRALTREMTYAWPLLQNHCEGESWIT